MNKVIKKENITKNIYLVRGKQVMLDTDLAELYGVPAKRLNEQVKRNIDRFPEEFRFQLSKEEFANLRSQPVTLDAEPLRSQNATFNDARNLRFQNGTSSMGREKHNAQYPLVEIIPFDNAHDRFMILDDKTVYHIGASLKDLGKRWFAFSKIEKDALKIIEQLKS